MAVHLYRIRDGGIHGEEDPDEKDQDAGHAEAGGAKKG